MEAHNDINFDPKKGWERFSKRVEEDQQQQRKQKNWMKYAAAVFIPVMLVSGLFLYRNAEQEKEIKETFHHVIASTGEIKEVKLPDGSSVWLNAQSEISYNFENKTSRNIRLLKGEAYFEVTHNAKKPFIVDLKEMRVQVYGTGFNINSYDKQVRTTLVHGSIGASAAGTKELKMKPGEQAIYQPHSNSFELHKVQATNYSNWRSGTLNFDNTTLREIASILERQYGYTFVFASSNLADMHFTATMQVGDGLPKILNFLSKVSGLQFKISNKTIMVNP